MPPPVLRASRLLAGDSARRGLRLSVLERELQAANLALPAAEAVEEDEWLSAETIAHRLKAERTVTRRALGLAIRMGLLQSRRHFRKQGARIVLEFARAGTDRELR